MKSNFYLLFSILFMLGSLNVSAQIGIGTTTPAPSAALEVSSSANNKGILIPRISATQKDAIASPAEGLLIYQTTAPTGFYYYMGTAWKLMANATDLATVSAGSIPYTGATAAVDLGAYDLKVNGLTVGKGGGSVVSNTANGKAALLTNTTGEANTANGHYALPSNTTGSYNTANGVNALYSNTTGLANTANGESAFYHNTTGSYNTANGVNALSANTTGRFNTADGVNSLYFNTTGSNNTAIGFAADVATGILTNATAIGAGAKVSASNTIQLGNINVTNVKTSGTITAGAVTYPKIDGAAGTVLTANANGIPTWAAASGGGADAATITGIIPVAKGGTGQTTVPGILSTLGFASNNVAIGNVAGTPNQGVNAGTIAIGGGAGRGNQGAASVAIGYVSGDQNQGIASVAIGPNAAQSGQGTQAVAIGYAAGQNGQGAYSVAIGTFAGNSQAANSIALNATGASLNPGTTGFFVDPIINRTATSTALYYNTTTKEITSGTAASSVDLTTNQSVGGQKTFTSNDGLLAKGIIGQGNASELGAGSRMMWYPRKSAFRAGNVTGTQWDDSNIGYYSTAMGYSTIASGDRSIAMGENTLASGYISTATGHLSIASGNRTTAMGYTAKAIGEYSTSIGSWTTTNGKYSTAMGTNAKAEGVSSIAMGNNVTAKSYAETVIGTNPDVYWYTPASTTEFNANDRLFVIGNGNTVSRNALVMLKDGTTTFSGSVTGFSFTTPSDKRLKRNIAPLQNSIAAIMQLKPVSYEKKSSLSSTNYSIKENGFIAQELQKVMPSLVIEGTDKDKLLSVNYTALIPVLTKAIQEQQKAIQAQQKQIEELKLLILSMKK